jgi:hypothetical protein
MASRLTVFFYIVLCLQAGIVLIIVPWMAVFGMGDWGDNFLLVYASQKMGLQGLQQAVASGWVRGAVTGLGLLNIAMAVWEMLHFEETVRKLEGTPPARPASAPTPPTETQALPHEAPDASRVANADSLSHHPRRDDARDDPGE